MDAVAQLLVEGVAEAVVGGGEALQRAEQLREVGVPASELLELVSTLEMRKAGFSADAGEAAGAMEGARASCTTGSTSAPPYRSGISEASHPDSLSARTNAVGYERAASISCQ